MGTSLIPANEGMFLNNQFNDLHATYGRPITIYQTALETVLVTNPENNYLYQAAPFNSLTSAVIQSGVFTARILYGKREELVPFNASANSNHNGAGQNLIRLSEGEVRIKLDPTGAAYLKGCQKVQFDNTILNVITDPRYHGLIGTPNFQTFYLKKNQ